jgi:hypothetical protein
MRFRERPPLMAWFVFLFITAILIVGVWALSVGVSRSDGSRIGVGLGFIAVSAPFDIFFASWLRPRVLSETTLAIPTLLGHREVNLSDIANVALLRVIGRRTAWHLVVWCVDAKQRDVGVTTKTRLGKGWREELTNDYLPNSRPGQAATAIWQRARAVQGNNGPLDRDSVADRLNFQPTTTAYWTPGEGGVEMQRRGARTSPLVVDDTRGHD